MGRLLKFVAWRSRKKCKSETSFIECVYTKILSAFSVFHLCKWKTFIELRYSLTSLLSKIALSNEIRNFNVQNDGKLYYKDFVKDITIG